MTTHGTPLPGSSDVVLLADERARRRPEAEPWLSKQQIATHLGLSTRWVELRLRDGMPSVLWGGVRRFRVSEVEGWLRDTYRSNAS